MKNFIIGLITGSFIFIGASHMRPEPIHNELSTINYDFGDRVQSVHISELFEYDRNRYWCALSQGESILTNCEN